MSGWHCLVSGDYNFALGHLKFTEKNKIPLRNRAQHSHWSADDNYSSQHSQEISAWLKKGGEKCLRKQKSLLWVCYVVHLKFQMQDEHDNGKLPPLCWACKLELSAKVKNMSRQEQTTAGVSASVACSWELLEPHSPYSTSIQHEGFEDISPNHTKNRLSVTTTSTTTSSVSTWKDKTTGLINEGGGVK